MSFDKVINDIVIAADKNDLSIGMGTARDRILNMLKSLHTENNKAWASVSAISAKAKVGGVYTRNVLKEMCAKNQVEMLTKDRKNYFRIVPV